MADSKRRRSHGASGRQPPVRAPPTSLRPVRRPLAQEPPRPETWLIDEEHEDDVWEKEANDGQHRDQSKEELEARIATLTDNVASLEHQVSTMAKHFARRSMAGTPTLASVAPSPLRTSRWSGRWSLREKPSPPQNPFINELDTQSPLNPLGEQFDYTAWIKNLMAVDSKDAQTPTPRALSLAFRNLGVHGVETRTNYQMDVFSSLLSLGNWARRVSGSGVSRIQILRGFDGHLGSGDMLLVLGRPGAGCSTFLKTLTGEMNGISTDNDSHLNYQGISHQQMQKQYRGEAIYTAEQDVHFPQLTVAQTLEFAARARVPRNRLPGVSRDQYAEHMKDVVMAIFGLTHCAGTVVGNDYVRGVSGGERKRVSIAEATLNGSPLQGWDNSTRGLDAANAVEFCKTLRIQSELFKRTACVALYQAPEAAYDLFHKVTVLYEGRQIYFGPTQDAKKFFTDMGFGLRERQTTADFLTALTNPEERIVRKGYERSVPRTPDDFVSAWKNSKQYRKLRRQLDAYDARYPIGGSASKQFGERRKAEQAKGQRTKSPYTLSPALQIQLCFRRAFARLRADLAPLISSIIAQAIIAIVLGSMFFNLGETTASLFGRSAILFYATLLNAMLASVEVVTIYAQRPIVEKHARYALYHPFVESIAAVVCELPSKLLAVIFFNLPLYFMANLRREPGAFFVFLLFSFTTSLFSSFLFRTVASVSRTMAQAIAPSTVLCVGLCLYSGFPLPINAMPGWSRWMFYINPLAYAFEGLMVNELSGREFACTQFVPSGPGVTVPGPNSICTTVGAVPGAAAVAGDAFLAQSFEYFPSHLWRNFSILVAFTIFFAATHLLAAEYVTEETSKAEVLLFRRKHRTLAKSAEGPPPSPLARRATAPPSATNIQQHRSVIHWRDVCYEIPMGKETKQILDHIDGWVKPGTCTALMGASGAGKTTLLDVLAARVRIGVVRGDIQVDGRSRDSAFQRKTGYVQQADLHIATATVREALRFSAVLRQPPHIPVADRVAYVEEVIQLMEMEHYADAIVGVPGEGLNIEQRKRLTIAVELVAKPELLILLDEPTSGLDSQTAWSIMNLLDTLKRHGQAVLCTIHQPSATIFQRFDRLLLLAKGQTVYFGDIDTNSTTMIRYFEANGASPCPPGANPAEWMFDVIGTISHEKKENEVDWSAVWRRSPEFKQVQRHLSELAGCLPPKAAKSHQDDPMAYADFTAPMGRQLIECTYRVFAHYWRSPSYIYSKLLLLVISALYIGLTFIGVQNSQQGVENKIFGVFMLLSVFANVVAQILRVFEAQRNIFETRERPAKIYSWQAFLIANVTVELCWNTVMAVLMFVCWYYPIGLNRDTEGATAERGFLMALYMWAFMLFATSFSHLIIAGVENFETANTIGSLCFSLSLMFCGVLVPPASLPRFWIWMYRVSPLTYLISGMMSTSLANAPIVCSAAELLHIPPPADSTCGSYLGAFLTSSGGTLLNPNNRTTCEVCPIGETNAVLEQLGVFYQDRWRNLGIVLVYVVFNITAAFALYYFVRVPRKQTATERAGPLEGTNDATRADSDDSAFDADLKKYPIYSHTGSHLSVLSSDSSTVYGRESMEEMGPTPPMPAQVRREDRPLPPGPPELTSALTSPPSTWLSSASSTPKESKPPQRVPRSIFAPSPRLHNSWRPGIGQAKSGAQPARRDNDARVRTTQPENAGQEPEPELESHHPGTLWGSNRRSRGRSLLLSTPDLGEDAYSPRSGDGSVENLYRRSARAVRPGFGF